MSTSRMILPSQSSLTILPRLGTLLRFGLGRLASGTLAEASVTLAIDVLGPDVDETDDRKTSAVAQ